MTGDYDHYPLTDDELADVRQWVAQGFPTPMRARPRNLRALVHRLLSTVDEAEGRVQAQTEAADLDEARLARAVLSARSKTAAWKGSARALEPTQWDRLMAKRIIASLATDPPPTHSEAPALPSEDAGPGLRGTGRFR